MVSILVILGVFKSVPVGFYIWFEELTRGLVGR